MKKPIRTLLAALVGLFVVTFAFAQEAAPVILGSITPDQVVSALTPVLVPLALMVVKNLLPRLPTWTMPVLAPILGVLIELVASLATQTQSNFWLAAAYGLAGVGLREVKETIKPAANGGWPVVPPNS